MLDYAKDEKAIFLAALEQSTAREREAYLQHACSDDPELLKRVKVLLSVHEQSRGPLDAPSPGVGIAPTIDGAPIAERPGTTIGPYKLLEQIGEGGFGVVFMAEQQQPVRRKVALKVLKPGMDTRQVVARFEAERQALALMDHPNIAHVFDGGTTEAGRPYFVMELVRGVPITEFCDQNCLAIRQRLELFVDVCQAVQHAHQKGVIHRDIKPTNVMVTLHDGQPVVKVIDFGIAKAMGQNLTEKTLFTNFAQLIGTPLYMSPEQAEMSGLDLDTRSDIYALGVLLYELLTGSTPFENERLSKVGYDEMRRIIREEEPPKPSLRISTAGKLATTASQKRQGDPRKLSKLFRGELDWIVMKALEKDRDRRYETANGFARDVERYLNDEPVVACPASVAYRFRKFARRNKRALASAAVLAVAGLVIAGTIGWAVRDRDAQAKEAARERASRRMLVEQAVGRALEQADELQKLGKWQEALVAVERAEAALASGEAGEDLRQQVGEQLADLRLVQRLDEIRSQEKETEHEHQHETYASVLADFGIDVESLSPPEVAARIRRRPGTTVRMAAALDDWAILLRDWGLHDPTRDPATWKRLLDAARLADPDPWRSQLRQLMGQEDLIALRDLAETSDISALPVQSLRLMGTALIFGGDAQACVAWLRRAHRQYPGDALIAFDLFFHLSNLPGADWAEVLRFAEAGLAARPTADMYLWVAGALMRLGRVDEAFACYQTVVELHPIDAKAHRALGQVYARRCQWKEAATSFARASELDPKDHWSAAQLGYVLAEQGDLPVYQKYCETMLSRWGEVTDPRLAERTANACLLLAGGVADPGQLAPLVQTALSLGEQDERLYPWSLFVRGLYDCRRGRFAEARTACADSRERAASKPELIIMDQTVEAMSLYRLGMIDEARGALAAAGRLLYLKGPKLDSGDLGHDWLGGRILLREAEETIGTRWLQAIELDPNDVKGHIDLGQIYARQGQWKQAAASLTRATELDPKDHWSAVQLGYVLAEQGDLPVYQKYCETMLSRWGKVTDPMLAERTAKNCLLLPGGVADPTVLAPLVQTALSAGEQNWLYPWSLLAQGLYDYRCGRFAEARTAGAASSGRDVFVPLRVADQSVEAMSLFRLGNTDEARQTLAAAGRLLEGGRPDLDSGDLGQDWAAWLCCRILLREAEQTMGTRWQAIELDLNDAKGHIDVGHTCARQGQWKEATAAFDRALELDPANRDVWILAAAARAAGGELEDYRRACAQIAQRFGDATDEQTVERCAKACLIIPDALNAADFHRVQKMADRAVAGTESHPLRYYFAMVKGLADYRAGRYAEAIQWTETYSPQVHGNSWDAIKFAVLAMAHCRLKHGVEAQAAFDNARAIVAKAPDPSKGQLFDAPFWHDWVHAQVLCREAGEMLETDPPSSPTKDGTQRLNRTPTSKRGDLS